MALPSPADPLFPARALAAFRAQHARLAELAAANAAHRRLLRPIGPAAPPEPPGASQNRYWTDEEHLRFVKAITWFATRRHVGRLRSRLTPGSA